MFDIKKFKDYLNSKNECIINIDDIFSALEISEDDIKTRIRIFEIVINHQNIMLMRKTNEVRHMEQASAIIDQKIKDNGQIKRFFEPKRALVDKKTNKESLIDESVQMYIDLINEGIEISEIIEDIKNRSNAREIIAGILLVYLGELKVYRELLKNDEGNNKEEISAEIIRIINCVNIIKDISSAKEIDSDEEDTITKANYKIAFYLSPSGNNLFSSDLHSLDESSYDSFQTLLESLIMGKMISYKKFYNHISLRGLKEVRLKNCRIAFLIDNGNLILLSAFVKKADVDDVIYNNIAQRIAFFNRSKEKMLKDFDESKTQEELALIIDFLRENKRVWGR